MMIADLRALADLWNRQYRPSADPDALFAQAPSPGVTRYCKIHEDNLAGATPYAQVAIEYEIEMLPLRFGEAFMTRCADVLGPDILSCLSFVTSHIQLDVAHTKTNAWAMAEVFREVPGSTPVLAAAGAAVLDAYAEYLDDCVRQTALPQSALYCHDACHDAGFDRCLCTPLAKPYGQMAPSCRAHKPGRSVDLCCSTVVGDRPSKPTVEIFAMMTPLTLFASRPCLSRRGAGRLFTGLSFENGPSCLTKLFSGKGSFASILRTLGAERNNVVELGRWIFHPSYRAGGRPARNWPQAGGGGHSARKRAPNATWDRDIPRSGRSTDRI
jgi:hypothetical protein